MNGERKTLTLLDKIMPKRKEDATRETGCKETIS